jgi:stalled ribosome rescue protein Dom34
MAILREEKIRDALKYGAVETLFLSKKLDKGLSIELKKLAENIGSNVEVISTETTEGEQFENLGGIGALLRFKVA